MFWQNLHELDRQVTLFINSYHCGWSDAVMQFFSHVQIWFPMYAVVAVLFFWRLGWKKGLVVLLSCVLCLVLCDQLANLFKDGIAGLYGFFSGHASNAFGFAVCSSMGLRNDIRQKYAGYSVWIFFWAFMVSISRIFVGKHYFGDVLVGIIFGTLIGLFCGWLARKVIRAAVKK